MAIRVGILDDHRSFGEALCLALSSTTDFECAGVTTGFEQCKEMLLTIAPDLLIIDYQLKGMTGFDCADMIRSAGIGVRIVMLTAHTSVRVLEAGPEHGIELVLSKDQPLIEVLQAISEGPTSVERRTASQPLLSDRQQEVLELMGQGMAPAEIAETLFISIHTARQHVKDVMRLLEAPTQLAAVTTAIRDGHIIPAR